MKSPSEQSNSGPRGNGEWCCSCGVWKTARNGMEECPVSAVRMGGKGLSHLWARGIFERAMRIWQDDANIRARSSRARAILRHS